jgi:hypothetical protein
MALALRTALLLAALLLVALPGQAAAKKGCPQAQAPPGNSEIDQYAESFPGSCGKQRFDPSRAGDVATGSEGAAAGAAAAAALSRATAPGTDGAGAPRSKPAAGDDPQGDSAVGGIAEAAGGGSDDGMGIWLPLILIGSVAVAVGAVGVGLLSQRAG